MHKLSARTARVFALVLALAAIVGFAPTQAANAAPTVTTTVTISSDKNPSVDGDPVTFTATIGEGDADVPTGSVTFFVDGVQLGTA